MKIFSRCLLFVSILFAHSTAHSQKDAPVAGDVIKLIQLVGKDYSSVSPEVRKEEIVKDRATIIATFKSYMTADELKAFNKFLEHTDQSSLSDTTLTRYGKFLTAKKDYEIKKGIAGKFTKATEFTSFQTGAGGLDDSKKVLDSAKHHYYKNKDSIDLRTLRHIDNVFNNSYVDHVANLLHKKHAGLTSKENDTHSLNAIESSVQKGIPFIGGDLSFETVIEGLSRFLASRIKEELTTYVIERVQDWLRNPGPNSPLNELKVLLPRTTDYLLTFNADQILNFTDEIKQYVEDDLNNIFENLPNLRNTPRIARLLEMHPDMDFAFEALELIPKLSRIKRPIEYFEILEGSRILARWSEDTAPIKRNISNAMALTCLIARSLTTMESGQLELVNLEDLDHYLDNDNFYLLYFGFLHQQNLKYYNANYLVPMGRNVAQINVTRTLIPAAAGAPKKASPVYQYGELATDSCRTCPIPLGSLMEQVMTVVSPNEIKELKAGKAQFEVLLGQLGLRIDKVNSTAIQIRKLNKKGEKVPVELATEFVDEIIDFSEQLAITGDTLVNFLTDQIYKGDKHIYRIIIDSFNAPKYSLRFKQGKKKDFNINLVERTAPYINAARSTNEIIIDLNQKKYATALLKGLEIVSEMIPENILTEMHDAIDFVENLQNQVGDHDLQFLEDLANKVFDNKSNYKKVKRKVGEHALAFQSFLTEFKTYYKANNTPLDVDFVKLLDDNRTLLGKIGGGLKANKFSVADLKTLKDLALDSTFKSQLIPYYSKRALGNLGSKLEDKMVDFVISTKKDTIHLFSRAEAKRFVSLLKEYAQLTIEYNLTGKKKIAKIKTIKAVAATDSIPATDGKKAIPAKEAVIAVPGVPAINNPRKDLLAELDSVKNDLKNFFIDYAFAFPSKLNLNPDSQIFKLIHFINDMARSESPEDVEKAIEAFALPSGSFAIKRTAHWNAAINSYPGILIGGELTRINNSSYLKPTASLSVPVGLSFAWGTKKGRAFGFYIPVIDVGAFTRVYLSPDSTANTIMTPEFNFQNILSPGAYFTWGFKKSPLSLNFGGQFGPEYRRLEVGEEEPKSYESWRIGMSITLDIPLLNLFTKPRIDRF